MKLFIPIIFSYLIFITSPIIDYAQSTNNHFTLNFEGAAVNIETLLSKYIQIESISGSEKAAGTFIKNLCHENGLHITQMGEANGNYNFAASIRPLSEKLPNILFLNHIDVVPPGDSDKWTYPAFSGTITDSEIWGRGAFDNKGAAIMQLASIIEINKFYKESYIPYNVTFLAVSCEETQCNGGVKYVIKNHLKELNPLLVIGEGPPALNGILRSNPEANIFGISVAHKRAFWVQLELEIETSGHGSVTPFRYANQEMVKALYHVTKKKQKAKLNDLNCDLLKQLGKLEKGITAFVLKHPRLFKPLLVPQLRKQPELFALFSNTITLTSVDSENEVINVIPNKSKALLDCRLLPQESRDDFLKYLKKRLKNDSIKITILNEMPDMIPSDEKNKYYILLKNTIKKHFPNDHVEKVFIPNFNDTGIFSSQGIPAFSVIPVKLDRSYLASIHNYNERIPRSILDIGKNVYIDFLKKCMEESGKSIMTTSK